MKRILVAFYVFVLSFSLVACGQQAISGQDITAYQNSCVEVSYDTLARNIDSMKCERVKITGKVFQITETAFNRIYMVDMSTGMSYGQHVFVTIPKNYASSIVIENDKVIVYGEVAGTQTYTTVLGAQRTIPKIEAIYVQYTKEPVTVTHLPDGTWMLYDPNTGETTFHDTNPMITE